jgi:hypothetical protein
VGVQDSGARTDTDFLTRIKALEQGYSILLGLVGSARALAQAIQTGLGNLASSGTTWAGPVASPSTITAATSITGGALSGTTLNTSSDATVGGILRNTAAYSNPITTSFRAVWVTSVDGQFGFNLSSREFKQDIADFHPDPATILALRLVTYRYIARSSCRATKPRSRSVSSLKRFTIWGLGWLVEYDNGKPCGIKFHLIAMALLVVAQGTRSPHCRPRS